MDLQVDAIQNCTLTKALGNIFKFNDGWVRHNTSVIPKRSTMNAFWYYRNHKMKSFKTRNLKSAGNEGHPQK
jgi:hypothetical protein